MTTALTLTVGTSPLPVLLSILAHATAGRIGPTDLVVLVHSGPKQPLTAPAATPWEPEAGHVRGTPWAHALFLDPENTGSAPFAGTVGVAARAMLGDRCPVIDFVTIGHDESDMAKVTEHLNDLVSRRRDVDRWMLDYTGGTAAMSAAAVNWHLSLGPGTGLRSYVDYTSNLLHVYEPAAGGTLEALPLDEHFTLDLVAFLHGFALKRLPRSSNAAAKHEYDTMRALKKILIKRHLVEESRPRCCKQLLPLGRDPKSDFECMSSIEALPLADPGLSPFAEFDGLLRLGNRITTVEVKSKTRDYLEVTGWRVRAASTVFGPATSSLMVTAEDHGRAEDAIFFHDLRASAGRPLSYTDLNTVLAVKRNTNDPANDLVHGTLFPMPEKHRAGSPPRRSSKGGDLTGGLLVTAAGAQSLSTITAIGAWALDHGTNTDPKRSGVLVITGHQHKPAAVKRLRDRAKRVAPSPNISQHALAVTDEDAVSRDTLAWAATPGPVTLDVTGGTKAATAGLVRARAQADPDSSMAVATLVATNPRTRMRSTPDKTIPAPLTPLPWELLLQQYATPSICESDHSLTRAAVKAVCGAVRGTGHEPSVWCVTNAPLIARDNCEYWAVTSPDRIVLIIRPERPIERPNKKDNTLTAEAAESFAIQADLAVAHLFGDAASTVLVDPFPANDPKSRSLTKRNPLYCPGTAIWHHRKLSRGARPFFPIDLVSPTYPPGTPIEHQIRTACRTIGAPA